MADTYEVYDGTTKSGDSLLRVYDDRRRAENFADDMAMRGRPACVYAVRDGSSERIYAVSL